MAATAASPASACCGTTSPTMAGAGRHRDGRRSRYRPAVRCEPRRARRSRRPARCELGRAGASAAGRAAHAPPWCATRRRPASRSASTWTGSPNREVHTGIGFFDHMLEQIAQARRLRARADLRGRPPDRRAPHHRGLRARARPGAEAGTRRQARHRPLRLHSADGRGQASVSLDLSGRPTPCSRAAFRASASASCRPNWCRTSSVRWPRPWARRCTSTVHGENAHHMIEACFKGVGRALRQAIRARATSCLAPRACCDRRHGAGRRRRCQHRLGAVRLAAARCRRGADRRPRPRSRAADQVILPGVGAAGPGMARLRELGLVELLRALRQPVLGVCLGMQLLFDASEEGDTECLGLIPAPLAALRQAPGLPCRTWAGIDLAIQQGRSVAGRAGRRRATPISCTATPCRPANATLADADYGGAFSAVVAPRNFWGMQFHPERSAAAGAKLLQELSRTVSFDRDPRHRPAWRPLRAPEAGRFAQQTPYADQPARMSRRYADAGARWVHVVDLDGARLASSPILR